MGTASKNPTLEHSQMWLPSPSCFAVRSWCFSLLWTHLDSWAAQCFCIYRPARPGVPHVTVC